MSKPRKAEDLSEQELRRLLLEKRRLARQQRIERFRLTGRALTLAPDLPPTTQEQNDTRTTIESQEENSASASARLKRRHWMDNVLLGVEILAVVGLAGVLINGFGLLRTLNQEVAAALQQNTLSPTPLITAVVLPGGHTPPSSPGGPQPNEAEIPEHLRPLVQSLIEIPIPTQGPEQASRIQISAIGIDAPIVQGDSWEQLKKGVGQHVGSANPGEIGNVVLSAHNDIFGELFRDLDQLQPGDQIVLFTFQYQHQYVYRVSETRKVEPNKIEVMANSGHATVTLISCYPYMMDNMRIVVFAELQNP